MATSASLAASTVTEVLAVLFATTESVTPPVTVTLWEIVVPGAVPVTTWKTGVNEALAPTAIAAVVEQFIAEPAAAPTAGSVQVHPAGVGIETNVAFAGTVWVNAAFAEATPLLVTVSEKERTPPEAAGFVSAVIAEAKSAEPAATTVVVADDVSLAGYGSVADVETEPVRRIVVPAGAPALT